SGLPHRRGRDRARNRARLAHAADRERRDLAHRGAKAFRRRAARSVPLVDQVRIDKWLWAARFFKTRSLATEAVLGGRVHVNGARVKPAKEVRAGDTVEVTTAGIKRTVVVAALSDKRGPASVAQTLYEETPESAVERERQTAERRLA